MKRTKVAKQLLTLARAVMATARMKAEGWTTGMVTAASKAPYTVHDGVNVQLLPQGREPLD